MTDTFIKNEKIADELKSQQDEFDKYGLSREQEEESDRYGAELAAKAGYVPYAFCDLFERLAGKVNADLIYRIKKIKGTHNALDERAKRLKEYLEEKGYKKGDGVKNEKEYFGGISTLPEGNRDEKIHTLTEEEIKDKKEMEEIENTLREKEKKGKKLTTEEFIKIIQRVTEYLKKYEIRREQLVGIYDKDKFMEELVFQFGIFDPRTGDGLGPAGRALINTIELATRLLLGIYTQQLFLGITVYEAISGYNAFTGDKLSYEEQILSAAFAGALAGSLNKNVSHIIGEATKDLSITDKLRNAVELFDTEKKISVETAEEINKWFINKGNYLKPPIKAGTKVYEGFLKETKKFYRLYSKDRNIKGNWFIDFEPKGYTPEELKDILALSEKPIGYCYVEIPAGTKIQMSIAEKNYGGKGTGVQYYVVDDIENFKFIDLGEL